MKQPARKRQRSHEPEPGDARNRPRLDEIVRAAYLMIAKRGFEGLRTRDVAEKVGINSATLHYYFPDKEALVQGVVAYLIAELSRPRVVMHTGASARDRLRAEFADIKARIRETPEQLIVLTELSLRALRDPIVTTALGGLDAGWHAHLVSILKDGIAEGAFRKDLDTAATASALMIHLRGLVYHGAASPKKLEAMVDQIALQTEHWVRK